ncbi:uncharacterized protein LOC144044299 [Vanacampus margaritifer]
MSDNRLSNASPPLEMVEAQQQDHVPPPMSNRGGVQEFMDRYNFDPINDRPLPDGNFEWTVMQHAPGFYSRLPHYSGESPRRPNGGRLRPSDTTVRRRGPTLGETTMMMEARRRRSS